MPPRSPGRLRFARLLLAGLAALALWVPLPFGSVVPWSHTVLQITAFLLLALAAVVAPRLDDVRPAVIPAACLAGVALLGAFQGCSWPAAIVRKISPEHARLEDAAREVLRASGHDRPVPGALSLAPEASRAAALTWTAVAACLLAAAAAGSTREHRRAIALAIVGSGLVQVLLGARGLALAPGTIWGVPIAADPSRLRGSFVNPDHLAFYLELVLPVAFAWGWVAARRAREAGRPERRVALLAGPVLAWLVLFVGLAFTGSRAGLVAAAAAVAAQGLLVAAGRRRWRHGLAGMLAALAGIGFAAAIGLQQALGRWLATSQYDLTWNDRLQAYGATLELWRRFPLTGSGLSSFRDAISMTVPHAIAGSWYWHAHNDYLEALATTGIVGAALIATALAAVLLRRWRTLRDAERSEERAAALAAMGAMVGAAIHSFFDFSLSMPANSVTLAIIVGAALGLQVRVKSEELRVNDKTGQRGARASAVARGPIDL
jgi:O-antigen ligase